VQNHEDIVSVLLAHKAGVKHPDSDGEDVYSSCVLEESVCVGGKELAAIVMGSIEVGAWDHL
jgi:hypothetical protein